MLKVAYDPNANEVTIAAAPQTLWGIALRFISQPPAAPSVKVAEATEPPYENPKSWPKTDGVDITRQIRSWQHSHRGASPTFKQMQRSLGWTAWRVLTALQKAVAANLLVVKKRGAKNSYQVNAAALGAL